LKLSVLFYTSFSNNRLVSTLFILISSRSSIMKKVSFMAVVASLLLASGSASADWFGDRWGGNNGYNDWPMWTPMYWMEEMADTMDDQGWSGRNNRAVAPNGYGVPAPYGYPQAPYYGYPQQAPYGYAPQQPYPAAPYYPAPQQPNGGGYPTMQPSPAPTK
jgi:hypothetical protein